MSNPSMPQQPDPAPMQPTLSDMLTQWGAILFMLGLFLVPVGYYAFQPELAQWKAAAAVINYKNGNVEEAIGQLTEAADKSGDELLRLKLTQWQNDELMVDEALANCERLLDSVQEGGDRWLANGAQGSLAEMVLYLKANALILKGEKKQALDTVVGMKDYYSNGDGSSIQRRNALAYYRALCGRQLGQASRDINSVIREQGGGGMRFPVTFPGMVAMSSGLVSRYVDRREEAARVIARRIEGLESESQSVRSDMRDKLYDLVREFLPIDDKLYKDANLIRDEVDLYQNEMMVLRSVLALLKDEMGEAEEASQLRHEVAESGFSCEEVLDSLPSEFDLSGILSVGAQFLDTRGYVEHVRGNQKLALIDLDLAVLANDTLRLSLDTPLQNTTEMRNREELRKDMRKRNAIMLYHRLLVHQAMGNDKAAEQDRQAVRDMGQNPGPHLF